MGLVKEILRAPVVSKLYNEYMDKLDMSFFPYDQYAKTVRSAMLNGISVSDKEAESKVSILTYDSVNEESDLYVDTDYVIFTSDLNGLDNDAQCIVADIFDKNDQVSLIYANEDEYNSNEEILMNPWFKPSWSPDTLLDHMYFGNMIALRSDILKGIGNVSNIYELALKVTHDLKDRAIYHADDALFHSHNLKKLYSGKEWDELRDTYQKNAGESLVSVIIPSKDNPDVLKTCLESFIRLTRDVRYEIIIVDNGSNDENKCKIEDMLSGLKQDLVSCGYVEKSVDKQIFTYLYKPQPFNFSRMCDQGAKQSKGDYLLFLNDDIEIREGSWLKKMLKVAKRPHTGAVGAKLYYPGSMLIQHAGIVNLRLGPVHKLQFKDDNSHYYMDLNNGVRNCIAVTGACLLLAKSKFDEVGGFCEELEVAFNDVDLCFRLHEHGYHNAVCNNTHLWHHESLSRGDDDSKDKLSRLSSERDLLYSRHPYIYAKDPYYSKHLSNDICDTGYSFIYEYDHRDVTEDIKPLIYKGGIKDVWYNECLMVSLEYAGSFEKFEDINADQTSKALISGYAYVAGSDNSCFSRSIVLKGERYSYIIKASDVYRPDLEANLDSEEYASMCGFSLTFDLKDLEPDTYRVCVLSESHASRLKLFKETNKYIRVNKTV
ncbi:MAG: glycosyltransferase family 2 protein [Lachnospiraceae bacterium]|nr:glycosyltransferase family 2 protein [Lachnospiraceae bacterium]